MDTPGVHKATGSLNTRIVEVALSCLPDMDAAIVILDGASPNPHSEKILFNALKKQVKPVILAVNKVDSVEKSLLAQRIDAWSKMADFCEIVPISARTGFQVDILVHALEKLLPSGPPFYPLDAITDVPERFIAAEMVREKIFRLTGEEIPYSTAVTIEDFSEDADRNLVSIQAVIHVERESQKGIIIGKNGAKLKQIGQAAREDIERMTGCRVFLKLFVRVQKNWTKDTRAINRFGY
jgi:GTP-binding protein Era